jgi:hypothetical protein
VKCFYREFGGVSGGGGVCGCPPDALRRNIFSTSQEAYRIVVEFAEFCPVPSFSFYGGENIMS